MKQKSLDVDKKCEADNQYQNKNWKIKTILSIWNLKSDIFRMGVLKNTEPNFSHTEEFNNGK